MKKLALFLLLLMWGALEAFSQVSDDQVIKMVRDAQQQGLGQQEIAVMLIQKGVTKEQIQRLKTAYEKGTLNLEGADQKVQQQQVRERSVSDEQPGKETQILQEQKVDGDKAGLPDLKSLSAQMDKEKKGQARPNDVYGRNIFNNTLLTFEPRLNIATPDNYVLGPEDEVIIDVWGASENTLRQVISPDGNIIVAGIGPIQLSGLTAEQANKRIKREFEKIYAGIGAGNTFVKLSLGNIRSIQVNVMGEVAVPGTYTLPSLASLFHALYHAGGVSKIGSLRSIKIYRSGKEVADVDVYDYIMEGKTDQNIILQDGDVVVVEPYQNLVRVEGKIKRPMVYELRNHENLENLFGYAGGFTGDSYKETVRIIRKSGRELQVYNIDKEDFAHFELTDGDQVTIGGILPRFENKAEIKGAVFREGLYAIGDKIRTLKQLVDKAEGVRGDAFLNRAVLYREKPDLTIEVMAVDMAALLNNEIEDIPLKKNDVLYIPSIFDLQEDYTIAVKGAVGYPGTYKYVDNMTLEDAVVQAGGLLESASTVKVDVARRIKNPKSTEVGEIRAETFTFTLKDGLVVEGPAEFTLKPFDEVYIRRSPGYQKQQNVFIRGEVMFGGEYTLVKKGERLSDLVKKAGGLTSEAYPEGARLIRLKTEDEMAKERTLLKLVQQGGKDSIDIKQLDLGKNYPVGIELEEALNNPGSNFDVILKEGDLLEVPEYNGTVKISGAVMYPNTVVFKEKAKLSYYISQAGGYAERAKKNRAFVIYMNGTVALAKGTRTKIKPGCEIIVPTKQPRKGMSLAEIMSLASSTTSMAAMVTSILNMTK